MPGRIPLRLFLTVWLVYAAHATTNVARETYLAVAIGERLTIQVDPYLGLHPDLFPIEGRGAYINSNPGASMLGAVPYALARPAIEGLFRLRPDLATPKPPAAYADPRPNRTLLMNEMRARGLDVRLALAALVTQFGLMAPLGALAAVLVFLFFRTRLGNDRTALWVALGYALVTPLLFRSAFLNQNALLAQAVLGTCLLLAWPGAELPERRPRRWWLAGLLLGAGLVLDYSAAPLALAFGCWALAEGWRAGGVAGMARLGGACLAGASVPLLGLLWYQWAAFGSPWFPAQRYMPATELSVHGWNGMTLPSAELLWRNLVDPRYGLLAFCPMLVAGLAAPFLRDRRGMPPAGLIVVALVGSLALLVFNSANQFAHLQWNTGVRYMVPAVPLLFLLAAPVLLSAPAWLRWSLLLPSALISWAVAATREDVGTALKLFMTDGPTLPILIVLRKTADAYAPWLAGGLQPYGMVSVAVVAALLVIIWRAGRSRRPAVAPVPR